MFTHYLADDEPTSYVIDCYRRLLSSADLPDQTRGLLIERTLLAFAREGVLPLRIADAYARFFRPRSLLRRRLVLLLAILENSAPTERPLNAGADGSLMTIGAQLVLTLIASGLSLVAGVIVLIWGASGFFIVQEGQQAVVTSFGKYSHTVDAGFNWRFPYPFQANEVVPVTQLRSVEVGRNAVVQATGLRESSMLTKDENIVDIRFTVQYNLKDARAYLFENKNPDEAVIQAAESAVREIVGKSEMDSVLYEQRDAISIQLIKSVQAQLDRLNTGILIVNVNVGSVQAPEQVQAAFDDAFRAGADREKAKNEGQAYANDVIPKAQGSAARLHEQAEAYKAQVIARAEGDAQRFNRVFAEYQKAPGVTRDRIYVDTMQQIYSNVTKVMVDSRNNSNLLYLPLDKLIQQSGATPAQVPVVPSAPTTESSSAGSGTADIRLRDGQRSRDRDAR